jgi:DNA end-binding protein Ku
MEALRRSVGAAEPAKPSKKPRKAANGQKEMLMPIAGKKPASKPQRKSA